MRIFVLSLLVALSASFAIAQPGNGTPPDPETMAERQTERMTEHLSLTEDQIPLIYTINFKYAKLRQDVREEADTREAAQMKMKSLTKDMLTEYKAVLDEDQMKIVEEHHTQRQGRKGKRGKGKQGPPEDPR